VRIAATWCLSQNIGDTLTPWLIRQIGRHETAWVSPGVKLDHYIVTGSVLNWASKQSIVWGAGLASWKDEVCPDASFRAVRGPLSAMRARSCGYRGLLAFGDPGLLLPRFVPKAATSFRLGVVPHYVDMARFASLSDELLAKSGVILIDPHLPVSEFANRISMCERVVSSSLHGLIIADAYGVPNVWAKFGDGIGGDGMKYWDYMASVGRAAWSEPPGHLDYRVMPADKIVEHALGASTEAANQSDVRVLQDRLMETCPFTPERLK
jgi:pyruvyltransferase